MKDQAYVMYITFEIYIYLSFVATITLPVEVVLNLHFRVQESIPLN